MPADLPLHPGRLALYGASLRPPRGTVFDAGVATTYSLDFETALTVPVALALFAHENRDELLGNPLALLQGLDRVADHLAVFCEAGRIQARAARQTRLCNLLERLVIEVDPPEGGSFHPKLWVLRYRSEEEGEPVRMRLLVMSRNLTCDRSWDVSLCLDGRVSPGRKAVNLPLVQLLERLPSLANQSLPGHVPELVQGLQQDLDRTEWTPPPPFEEVSFAFNGPGRHQWEPRRGIRLAVVSPYCDGSTLAMLAGRAREPGLLVSRAEELIGVDPPVLERFDRVLVLDELARHEDGEAEASESDGAEPQSGLHAKLFVQEWDWRTTITVGSGNATRPALLDGRNIEVFATLTGLSSRVGRIDEIFGRDSLGRILRRFQPGEIDPADTEMRSAERRLELARRELTNAELALSCTARGDSDGTGPAWGVALHVAKPIGLEGLGGAASWPVTRGNDHSVDVLTALRHGGTVVLGNLPLIDITRFIAFQLEDAYQADARVVFALGLRIDGLPPGRHSVLLNWVVDSREKFLSYLRLLLADLDDPLSTQLAAGSARDNAPGGGARDDEPLLEDLVEALATRPDRLHAVRRLIERLERESTDAGARVVPEAFRNLWAEFCSVLDEEEGKSHA